MAPTTEVGEAHFSDVLDLDTSLRLVVGVQFRGPEYSAQSSSTGLSYQVGQSSHSGSWLSLYTSFIPLEGLLTLGLRQTYLHAR